MSFEHVKQYFEHVGLGQRVIALEMSSATVEEAAKAINCQPKQIAKTMSFFLDEKPILIVTAGDAKVDNKKYKNTFHQKAKMIPGEQVESCIGHAPGGVCPFTVNSDVTVFLDISLKRFERVYPAGGDGHSAVSLSLEELEEYSNYAGWVDVCKDWFVNDEVEKNMKNIELKQYVVDAFTDQVFKGNPAAVCLLSEWLSDTLMQNIAIENNLSETAFAVKNGNEYELRWFTPGGEIDLCGHATLGTAYVLLSFVETDCSCISFQTKSGQLIVTKVNDLYEIDMPSYQLTEVPVTDEMEQAIGFRPSEAWIGRDLVCVMADEHQVLQAVPDEEKLKKLDGLLLQLTARGTAYDCVTRSFAPKLNVSEDPVCGSGHCHVIPLWADRLKKSELLAFQASRRSGVLYCHMENDRVILAGKAVLYSKAEISVPREFEE